MVVTPRSLDRVAHLCDGSATDPPRFHSGFVIRLLGGGEEASKVCNCCTGGVFTEILLFRGGGMMKLCNYRTRFRPTRAPRGSKWSILRAQNRRDPTNHEPEESVLGVYTAWEHHEPDGSVLGGYTAWESHEPEESVLGNPY